MKEQEEYYKSLKKGDSVEYYCAIPWDSEKTKIGRLKSVGEWDDDAEPKMGVVISTLDEVMK